MIKTTLKKSNSPKWHWLYFLLAVIDLLAVGISLTVSHSIMNLYETSTEINQVWANRLGQYVKISELATAANGPGNDVFDNGEINAERKKFVGLLQQFYFEFDIAKLDLEQNLPIATAQPILAELLNASKYVKELTKQANIIFDSLQQGDPQKAGSHMASMDRAFANSSFAIARASAIIRNIQSNKLLSQVHEAQQLKRFEFVIAALMLLMISCVLIYGHFLSNRMTELVTQQQQSRILLEQSENFNRQILENIAEAVIICDKQDNIKHCNKAVTTLLNYPENELLTKNFTTITLNNQQYNNTLYCIHKTGDAIPVLITQSDMTINDELLTVRIIRDISQQVAHQEQLQKSLIKSDIALEAKNHFLTTMSHEIRTPMNGIIGMCELLTETELNPEQRNYTEMSLHSANSLLKIINDILDFSKIEAGIVQFQKISFNLQDLAEQVIDNMTKKSHQAKLKLLLRFSSNIPINLCGDPNRIRQVLVNLINNAIKFSEHGTIVVFFEKIVIENSVTKFITKIIDQGIGIASENLESIFDKFDQEDASTTRRYGGTGIGLTISRQLCRLMHGDIHVESKKAYGSTFNFSFAAEIENSETASFTENSYYHSWLNWQKRTVLIVNHCDFARSIWREQLPEHIFQLTEIHYAKQALDLLTAIKVEAATQQQFDYIIIDSDLPDFDGAQLIIEIKQLSLNPNGKLILINSNSNIFDEKYLLELQINGYLSSPTHVGEVAHMLHHLKSLHSDSDKPILLTRQLLDQSKSIEKIRFEDITILVVEDDAISQRVVLEHLKLYGCKTSFASNGQQALEKITVTQFDVIFMDCQMPIMDGFEATKKIRQLESQNELDAHTIIAFTASALQEDEQKCIDAGMDDYICKPIVPQMIKEKLLKWLPNKTQKMNLSLEHKKNSNKQGTENVDTSLNSNLMNDRILDREAFNNIGNLFGDKFQEAVAHFNENTSKNVQKIEVAITEKDIQTLQLLTHTLKGSSAQFGATELFTMSLTMEEYAQKGMIVKLKSLIDELHQVQEKVATLMHEVANKNHERFKQV